MLEAGTSLEAVTATSAHQFTHQLCLQCLWRRLQTCTLVIFFYGTTVNPGGHTPVRSRDLTAY